VAFVADAPPHPTLQPSKWPTPPANIRPFIEISPRIISRGRDFISLWPLQPHKLLRPFHLALVLCPAQVRVCRPFFCTFPTWRHPTAQILLHFRGDPVCPSLYRLFQSVLPPRLVVPPMSARPILTPMAPMLHPLLWGVGLVSGLLLLMGGDFILFIQVGGFLLQLMRGFLLMPLIPLVGASLCWC
jgi:hypothetical protein